MNTRFTLHALHITCSEFHLPAPWIYCYLKKKRFSTLPLRLGLQTTVYSSNRRDIFTLLWKMFFEFVLSPKIDRSEHTFMLKDWPLKPTLMKGDRHLHKHTN